MVLFYEAETKILFSPRQETSCAKGQVETVHSKGGDLCAVGRPQWDLQKQMWLDGKIGIWPFVEKKAAIKNSRNFPKGTLDTKNIACSVNAEEYKRL